VLVVAKRREVAAKLGRAFQTRSVRKIYWALVKGVPKPPQGKVEAALVKAAGPEGDRVRKARPGEQEVAQSAVTYYAVVDRAGQQVAWLSLKPVTGRQHQLRAHMAIIGHPILGDVKYHGDRDMPEGIDNKLHLHARRISFPHPSGKGVVDITAPLPDHMRRSFAAFGFTEADETETGTSAL
jgi:23S rRNA pseudouridine955/2504/2580 synthase